MESIQNDGLLCFLGNNLEGQPQSSVQDSSFNVVSHRNSFSLDSNEHEAIKNIPGLPKLIQATTANFLVKIPEQNTPQHQRRNYSQFLPDEEKQASKKKGRGPALKITEAAKKRLRRESNKEAARNSRKKKKEYIEILEKRVQELEQEVEHYKSELERNSSLDRLFCVSAMDSLEQKKVADEQNLNRLNLALQLNAKEAVESAVAGIIQTCGSFSEERKIGLNTLADKIVDSAIPVIHQYFLWASHYENGFYNTNHIVLDYAKKESENQEMKCEENKIDEFDEIITKLEIDPKELMRIHDTKDFVMKKKEAIRNSIAKFNDWKNNLLEELTSLDSFLEEQITSNFQHNDLATLLTWIFKIKDKAKFKDILVNKQNNNLIQQDLPGGLPVKKIKLEENSKTRGNIQAGKRPKIFH